MPKFATYLHPQTCHTSKPANELRFSGYSYPHYAQMRTELADKLKHYPTLPVRLASEDHYLTVHTADYLEKLKLMAAEVKVADPPRLSLECTGYEYCLPGYLYGLGGMLAAIDAMKAGTLERAFTFCLGGHHAYQDWGHGYCLLNPLAAAARYAQTQGFERVLIVDWDIHHGDGTQAIFARDATVHCLSSHSIADLYITKMAGMRPGTTTAAAELGHSNVPILHGIFEDTFFEELNLPTQFYRAEQSLAAVQSALDNIPWLPDLILIFAGCDSHRDDCGDDITNWTEQDFQSLTRYVLAVAQKATCPILSTQGGGYNLEVNIPTTMAHVETMNNE